MIYFNQLSIRLIENMAITALYCEAYGYWGDRAKWCQQTNNTKGKSTGTDA